MRPNFPFLSAALNAILKPGGLLKWKKRLVKDVRLWLALTEVMKIARLTSPLPDVFRQSSPRPWLRHGMRFALLSHSSLTLTLCTLSFVLSLALLTHLLPLLTSPNCSSPRESISVYVDYLRSHFTFFEPKALRSRARGYLSELRRATCPEESHLSFCSLLSSDEFSAAASNFSLSTATGPDKVSYAMPKHLPRFGMDFLYIFNFFWILHSFASMWKTSSIIPILKIKKPLDFPASFRPILLTCVSKLFKRIILSRSLFFLESNSILSPRQDGLV